MHLPTAISPGCMTKIHQPAQHGTAKICIDTPSPIDRMQGALHGMPLSAESYTRLFINDELWMTDAEFESASYYHTLRDAKGDILVGGLGIGFMLPYLLSRPWITSVTVLEREADVIALVGPKFQDPKLKIIHADVYEWIPPRKAYDLIFMDIWPNVPNTDNEVEIEKLRKRYRPALKKGGKFQHWCQGFER